MSENALERWTAPAMELPARDFILRQPVYVLIGEAHDLSALCKKHWKTRYSKEQEILEPGLDLAGTKLKSSVSEHLRSLAEAVQQAHSSYLLVAGASGRKELIARANFVVDEIKSVLEWHLDDGVEDENDARLAKVGAEHAEDPETSDALAAELRDYAALAGELRDHLDGLGGFDAALIDEAITLAAQLRELPSDASEAPERIAARDALNLRNRLAWLLQQQMTSVRAAARFVFRHHPELSKSFSSTYERKKRAASRRSARNATPEPTPPKPPEGGGS